MQLPHRALEQIMPHETLVSLDGAGDVCVLTIGAGLLMATVDMVHDVGGVVHCAADLGGLRAEQIASAIDWASATEPHTLVVFNAWRSLGSCLPLARELRLNSAYRLPESADVLYRLRGYDDDRARVELAGQWCAWEYRQLETAVRDWCTAQRMGVNAWAQLHVRPSTCR